MQPMSVLTLHNIRRLGRDTKGPDHLIGTEVFKEDQDVIRRNARLRNGKHAHAGARLAVIFGHKLLKSTGREPKFSTSLWRMEEGPS